ncbi:iron-containing alcohol dehydrogenase [Treponema zuelzerae]|uniref:Iron-containing alcohol dehydrogenase n=1 Tax=Teretinema zuelzerae TaxID=156 RepID=A0AAE3EG28_9SPIR|nr:iron-containing alcohol dehydrogenase [Teretinema zuelzerae]MBN2811096.1 iron-containing alcohol dehydrogenase [Spirochaetales bacterium]MCD1653994.1 iron-containing alcohol dehydrogenase [Teretinema zuelzerae]
MLQFEFENPTRIVFGQGVENTVGRETARHASKVLLHFGGASALKSGLLDRVRSSLTEAGVEYRELGGVQPNPRLSLVLEGMKICRDEKIPFILAVGGGSVIDSAKAIAAAVPYAGDPWDFWEYSASPETALPVGVVLTIPAAGSETSGSTVITNAEKELKRGLTSQLLRPRFALMNPELTMTLPAYQTACGAADIMAHVMERYFTNTRDVEFTDRLCEATLKTVISNVPRALENPQDYAARAEIMWAGTIAHNDLLGTGREQDWASHGIEHELSALYDIAHGAGLAIVFPSWMRRVYRHDPARFARFAHEVFAVEYDPFNIERTALEGIGRLESFFRRIGLPVRLSEAGIPADRIPEMARKSTLKGGGMIGGFVKLDSAAVQSILEAAL